jgi:hypothetical protein
LGNEDALAPDLRCANVGITVRAHRALRSAINLRERERPSGTVVFMGEIVRMPWVAAGYRHHSAAESTV